MKRDLEFLYEVGALRLLPRQWQRFHLRGAQNITEHHFRVLWLALIIAANEGVKDTAKIMKMALVHDISESRTNDVDYMARQYVERHEDRAIADMLENTSLKDEFLDAWHEYHERTSIEAKIVKDADNLDVDMELREFSSQGSKLEEMWSEQRETIAKTQLFTKTAKRLQKEIRQSDPHSWHSNSPSNRLNGGDWRIED